MQERRFNSPRRELMQNLIKLLNANIFGLHYFGRSTCPPAKVCFRCLCVRLLCNLAVGGGIGAGRREGRVDGGWGGRVDDEVGWGVGVEGALPNSSCRRCLPEDLPTAGSIFFHTLTLLNIGLAVNSISSSLSWYQTGVATFHVEFAKNLSFSGAFIRYFTKEYEEMRILNCISVYICR